MKKYVLISCTFAGGARKKTPTQNKSTTYLFIHVLADSWVGAYNPIAICEDCCVNVGGTGAKIINIVE